MAVDDETLIVTGGMTQSCSSDATIHHMSSGSTSWESSSPSGFVRRHGAGATSTGKGLMVVGGLVDSYVCASSTSAYAGYDILSSLSSAPNPTGFPTGFTGSATAVSDFAMTTTADGTVYLTGGQTSNGTLVPLDTIAKWSAADGWSSQTTKGNAPAGRLGASLVAHPTLDALVLYGGSTKISDTWYSASSVVGLLNTTTWTWSFPTSIQQSLDGSVSYHSAVMTPEGVMISAFGRDRNGYPSTQLNYLDMRDPTGSAWGWTSTWSEDMLSSYTPAPTTEGTTKPAASKGSNKGLIAAAVVPTVIALLVIIPVIVWLVRRHMRNNRQRRLASHFSFSTQEDRGDFNNGEGSRYMFSSSFGSHGSLTSMSRRVMSVFRRGTKGVGDDGTIHEGQMVQVQPSQLTEKGNRWEEIDFGLGRVDAGRRDGTYTDLPARLHTPRINRTASGTAMAPETIPFPMPVASTMAYSREAENPFSDENSVQPSALAVGDLVNLEESPRLGSPRSDGQALLVPIPQHQVDSALTAAGLDAAATELNDWNMLEQSIMSRPAFQKSPNSSVRSHAHSPRSSPTYSTVTISPVAPAAVYSPSPSPAPSRLSVVSTAPSIPPLPFEEAHITPTHTRTHSGDASGSRQLTSPSRRSQVSQVSGSPASRTSRPRSDSVATLNRPPLHVTNPSQGYDNYY
jgi:hypothetical protein